MTDADTLMANDEAETSKSPNAEEESATHDSGNELVQLMDLLAHEAATWEEVEDLLQDFPGWLRVVRFQQEPLPNMATRTIYMGPPVHYALLTEQKRKHLADIFRPFAVLLDTRLTAGERAVRLQTEAGVDAARFCREHLRDGSSRVVEAAQEVLEATRQQKSLLRQAASVADLPDRLLRPAHSCNAETEHLLQPANASPQTERSPLSVKLPLWQRLFGRGSR